MVLKFTEAPLETLTISPSNCSGPFAENLLQLVENEDRRIEMGKKGWELVHEKYHYNRLVSDMKNLYTELLR